VCASVVECPSGCEQVDLAHATHFFSWILQSYHEPLRRGIVLAWILLWAIVMLVALFGKWAMDSTLSVWEHYTNISWFWQAITYLLIFLAQIIAIGMEECPCDRKAADPEGFARATYFLDGVLIGLFWPAYSTAWIVYVVVFIIIGRNPELLTHLFKDYGGDLGAGTVIVGNEVYHSFPVILNTFIALLMLPDLMRSIYVVRYRIPKPYRVFLVLWGIYLGPIFGLVIYSGVVDYQKVYATNTPMWFLVLIVLATLTLIPGSLYVVLWISLPYFPHSVFRIGNHVRAAPDQVPMEAVDDGGSDE
jgi:hypothetical protein